MEFATNLKFKCYLFSNLILWDSESEIGRKCYSICHRLSADWIPVLWLPLLLGAPNTGWRTKTSLYCYKGLMVKMYS